MVASAAVTGGDEAGLVITAIALMACSSTGPETPESPPAASTAKGSQALGAVDRSGEYRDAQAGYRVVPPDGWRVGRVPGLPPPAVAFFEPAPDASGGRRFPVNINVLVSPSAAGLDANVAGAKEQLPEILPNYRL